MMYDSKKQELIVLTPERGCSCIGADDRESAIADAQAVKKELQIDLIVIDLSTCKRCVPTGDTLRNAITLLAPIADVLGIELKHREIIVQTPQEAKACALLSSPTIRINGRDIAQDIRESLCESCGDLTNTTQVDCREWHYRGKVYYAAPLSLLVEAIMGAMLDIDACPVVPSPLEKLPENLQRYFIDKKRTTQCC